MSHLYFLHGMESSPQGTKAQLLKQQFPQCIIPELPPDITKREQILEGLITEPSLIVGSSLGGLSAILLAMKKPDLIREMVLLAPAVGFYSPEIFNSEDRRRIDSTFIPLNVSCTILAAKQDNVIPLSAIKKMMARSPEPERIRYREVEDEHSLNRYPDLLLDLVKKMLAHT